MPRYENFEIVIEPNGADSYSTNVRQPCGGNVGDASGGFSRKEIDNIIEKQGSFAGTLPTSTRNFKPVAKNIDNKPEYNQVLYERTAKNFGIELSKILFSGDILERFGECKQYCREPINAVLRIRLDLSNVPELAALPWEYLRTTNNENFICLNTDTTLVRYLRTANAIKPLKINLPLRILVAAAVPKNLNRLAKDEEIRGIRNALSNINERLDISADILQVDVLEKATVSELEQALKNAQKANEPYHIFHFIGHGDFNEETKQGLLLFEDEDGNSAEIGHETLGQKLKPYNSNLRFVFLNACEGSRHSITDTYSSVAAKLMEVAEIPAVIAMQFNISDRAAINFATAFYNQVAGGESLEQAVDTARSAISPLKTAGEEWATPVFYLRANEGQLFDIKIPIPPEHLSEDGHYGVITELFPKYNLVVFLGMDVNYYANWKPGKGIPNTSQLCSHLNTELRINPPKESLASLAKQLELRRKPLSVVFKRYFNVEGKPSKLYRILGQLTHTITEKPAGESDDSDDFIDPFHSAPLFVTTTYDYALEQAFKDAKVSEYHVVYYRKGISGTGFFSHKHYRDGKMMPEIDLVAPIVPSQYTGLSDKFPVILKIPGEITDASGFTVTEDDFLEFAYRGLSDFLPKNLLGQINTSCHLYLGYDLQNWTLRLLWNRICENQGERYKTSSYAVVFDERDDPNVDFWKEKKINLASAKMDDYVAGLEKYVLNELQ